MPPRFWYASASPRSPPLPLGAMLGAGVLTAQLVAGTATRDALYFAQHPVSSLPLILIATAGFSILLVAITARAFRRVLPTALVPAAFALSAALFVGEFAVERSAPALAAQLVYLHVSGLVPVLASGFWLIVTEHFDPRTAKRRFGSIAAAGTLGGVAGGLLAERVATLGGIGVMLPVLAALSLACAVAISRLPRSAELPIARRAVELPAEMAPDAPRSGLRVLGSTPYLRHLAILVLLTTMAAVLLDYEFKLHAVAVFGRGENLLRFFAVYYAAISLVTFVVQASSSRLILETFGLTVATAMPSVAVILGGIGGLLVPGLASALIARGGQTVLRGSLFRSAYETFYTPVASADKRAAKSLIDVSFDKLGDAAGAGVVSASQSLALASQDRVLLGAAVLCSALALVVSTRLRHGYVATLQRSLLSRAVELDLTEVHDALTRTVALQVLRQPAATLVRSTGPVPGASSITARPDRELLALIGLRSHDKARIVRILATDPPISPLLVSHVVPLLAWDAIADSATEALRTVAESRIGEFTDALLDSEQPFAVRRRLARVFTSCRSQRAVDGLMLGLDDSRFEVRLQCGRSLAAITKASPQLRIETERVLVVVQREATVSRRVWESRQLLDRRERDGPEPLIDELVIERGDQSLAHVFTLLSLVFPREPLRIAFQGLHTDDGRLRGTALEYLALILPPQIHQQLSPFLGGGRAAGTVGRSRDAVVAELLLSNDSILLNLADLKQRAAALATRGTS